MRVKLVIDFSVTLVTNESGASEVVNISIPEDDWHTFKTFYEDVESLRSTSFIQNRRGGQVNLTFSAGRPVFSCAEKFNMEEVWAMLHKLRTFILQTENHHFPKIKNRLKRRIEHHAFRKQLDFLHEAYTLKTMQKRFLLNAGGRQIFSKEVIDDWLNSFQYHRNINKIKLVEADLGIFGKDQQGAPVIMFALSDMITSILHLGDFIENLLHAQDGRINKISCQEDYFYQT